MSTLNGGQGNIITNGLVLRLDAANPRSYQSGSLIWNDLSGNGNSGSLVNGPAFTISGSGAIVFDGVDDYVTGNITPLSGSAFTVCIWIYPLATPSTNTFFSIGSVGSSNTAIVLRLATNTSFRFGLYADDLDTTITPATGNWSYMVCSLNNSRLQSTYQNNILTGTRTASNMFIGSNLLTIGAWGILGVIQHTNLNVGSVQVYNRALNQSEIEQNYNATRARFGV
jgi:hypothetical protein